MIFNQLTDPSVNNKVEKKIPAVATMSIRYGTVIYGMDQRVKPPSTQSTCPVMNGESQKNITASATSSAVPMRPAGVSSMSALISALLRREFILVSISPGATQFTVIPEGPSSFANALVMPDRADLDAEYADSQEPPLTPHMEETLTILPECRGIMCFAASRHTR